MWFKQKTVEYSNNLNMLVKIFGGQDFVAKYDKHWQELKRTEIVIKWQKSCIFLMMLKLKLNWNKREEITQNKNKFEVKVNEIVQNQQTADSILEQNVRKKIIHINPLLKTVNNDWTGQKENCIVYKKKNFTHVKNYF